MFTTFRVWVQQYLLTYLETKLFIMKIVYIKLNRMNILKLDANNENFKHTFYAKRLL